MKVYHNINDFKGRNPVVTVGMFDGVHNGHQMILSRVVELAKKMKTESVVYTLWPHPRQVFNPENTDLRFLSTINEKIELIERIGIDHVIIYPFDKKFAKLTACEFIQQILVSKLHAKYLVVGFNHKFGKDQEGNFSNLTQCTEAYDFEIEKLEAFTQNKIKVSSTQIREALEKGKVNEANQFLGYPYFISGKVIGGSQIGRQIGFPTANIQPDEKYKLIPSDGVYAVNVEVNGDKYQGMLNIGIRPTISDHTFEKSIEVHIIDFDADLYTKKIRVHFIERIRDEKKFPGVEALKNQLIIDKAAIIKALK